ncbi:MAG TPA: thioredoxin domain-containing protein [Solirubrobacterales bacterium]|nr:thioredoxin domain-containing protein [Solirubrobacterales bacterium]
MASRKEEKEQRKRERLEAEEAAAAEDRRKKLFAGIGVAALAAVVVVVALVVVSQSGDDGGGGDPSSLSGVSEIEAEVGGLPQSGKIIGDADAKVTVREFGDLQCPACAQFSETVIPDLLAGPIAAGDANLEFNNFVIIGPDSDTAARAALAASEQDRYWQFVELFYRNQGAENGGFVTDDFLTSVAEGAGVPDIDAWEESRNDAKWDERLADTQTEANTFGLTSTPSIVVEGPGGSEVVASNSVDEIESAIDSVS